MANLEDLKKAFIRDEENFEENELAALIEKISKICILDKSGNITFKSGLRSDKEKIKYILIARFLANKLNPAISKEVSNQELEKILKIPKPQIRARISDLRNDDMINDLSRNVHEIKPLQIHKILLE